MSKPKRYDHLVIQRGARRVEDHAKNIQATIDHYAEDGWELAGMFANLYEGDTVTYAFKRPVHQS